MTGRPRSKTPKRTSMVKILVTPKLHKLIRAAAALEGDTVSDVGRQLFELLTNDYVVKSSKKMLTTPLAFIRGSVLP